MSDINFEQRCAIRFCFRLEHSATDTFAKLEHVYGDSVFSRAQVSRWFKAFSEESRLKVNHAGEDLHPQEPMKMSIEYGILCIQIVGVDYE
ncbi:hypothetical protein NQ318_021699 [Aromia moschata]|uniref:Mos1 transposase HTH domain-containing protein n=1 Tax=Aromia moschata TaxID=1265417 RepID=A0AAV8YDV4_9CUCU|nr:hypothetical protein NQ318_021699 [Aromia moschata]